jgi:hypothetical protein
MPHIHKWKVRQFLPDEIGARVFLCECDVCHLWLRIDAIQMPDPKLNNARFLVGSIKPGRTFHRFFCPAYVPAFCYEGDVPDSFMLKSRGLTQMIKAQAERRAAESPVLLAGTPRANRLLRAMLETEK